VLVPLLECPAANYENTSLLIDYETTLNQEHGFPQSQQMALKANLHSTGSGVGDIVY
jgi:hypothetical protein